MVVRGVFFYGITSNNTRYCKYYKVLQVLQGITSITRYYSNNYSGRVRVLQGVIPPSGKINYVWWPVMSGHSWCRRFLPSDGAAM